MLWILYSALVGKSSDRVRLVRDWARLNLHKCVLFLDIQTDAEEIRQLVVPNTLRQQILTKLHDGHDMTQQLLKSRFFWPGMSTVEHPSSDSDFTTSGVCASNHRRTIWMIRTSFSDRGPFH